MTTTRLEAAETQTNGIELAAEIRRQQSFG
jgi:hypothetical protein